MSEIDTPTAASNSARRRASVGASAKATSSARAVDRPELVDRQADHVERPLVLVGQRQVRDGRVVGRQGDRHAQRDGGGPAGARRSRGRCRPASSRSGTGRASMPRAISSRQRPGSSIAPGPWAIRSGIHGQRPPDLRRAAPLAGVDGDPEPAVAGDVEGGGVERRVGEAPPPVRRGPSRSGRRRGSRAAVSASSTFAAGSCDRSAVQISRTSVPVRAAASRRPARHRRDAIREGEAARGVERRPPADLDVADALGRLRLDELARRPARAPRRPA